MIALEPGTPLWANLPDGGGAFGCVEWVSRGLVGIRLLAGGVPQPHGQVVTRATAQYMALELAQAAQDGHVAQLR